MDKNPLNQSVVTAHGLGFGVGTQKMIRVRAAEMVEAVTGIQRLKYDSNYNDARLNGH